MKPKVLVLTGYGINCDDETKFAFEKAGASAEIVHINDLIDKHRRMRDYQIQAFPGGFSYGDDTGAGIAFANRVRARLGDDLTKFLEEDKLVIGICNGFQILVNLGIVPALNYRNGDRQAALVSNDFPRYEDRWVDLEFLRSSPWVDEIRHMSLPIAHGEGKFYAEPSVLSRIREKGLVAARYVEGKICSEQRLASNPNGSLDNIAGITNETGRVLGMMPHPERAIDFTHLPNWTEIAYDLRIQGKTETEFPEEADGIKIFRNGVNYFK